MRFNILKTELFLLEKNIDSFRHAIDAKSDLEIKIVSPADCKKAASENNWQNNFSVNINEIVEESNVCALAEVNGSLVHWTQITFGTASVAEIKRRIKINPESAYLHGIYTITAFRKRGITSEVIEKILMYLNERKIRRIYILIDVHNNEMLKVAEAAGFKKLGKASLFTIGSLCLFRSEGNIKSYFV
jgi:hypothetical protein